MSVDNYLDMLQDLQREYRRVSNKITISTDENPYTTELAGLHSDASEWCRKITALLGNSEDSYELRRWERRRADIWTSPKRFWIISKIKETKILRPEASLRRMKMQWTRMSGKNGSGKCRNSLLMMLPAWKI